MGRRHENFYWECSPHVVRVEDDPTDPDRVIVTDICRNRASMTIASFHGTCRLADDVEMLSTRVGWDG